MARLLLRADGVLFEDWHPLGLVAAAEYIPPEWTGPHVGVRFADAIRTLLKMPLGGFGPRGVKNCWPKFRWEWADLLAMLGDGGETIDLVRQERNRVRIPPSSQDISRMERAIGWPSYLRGCDPYLGRAFNVVGLAAARDVSVEDIVRHGKHGGVRSATEWHKLSLRAADVIAAGLRSDQVVVF
jgi:hypothetical protein